MIGKLTGILIEKQAPSILIDVNGVGYEVDAPLTTFFQLPEIGQQVSIFTHFVVREDAQLLYGFIQKRDRSLFRALIKVNGVGPKLALTILSGMDADAFAQCVLDGNATSLVKLPGVGKKTAERLIIEMQDRLKDWNSEGSGSAAKGVITMDDIKPQSDARSDAESALVSLGYKSQEAAKMVAAVFSAELSSEELIKHSLRSAIK